MSRESTLESLCRLSTRPYRTANRSSSGSLLIIILVVVTGRRRQAPGPPERSFDWWGDVHGRLTCVLVAVVLVLSACSDANSPNGSSSTSELRREKASGAGLYAALLTTPLEANELPNGFRSISIGPGTGIDGPSAEKVGSIIVDVDGPDQFNSLRYEVLRTVDMATAEFQEREANAREFGPRRGARVFKPDGFSHPSLCVDDRNIGTECLVLVENVIVFASAANDPPLGRFLDTATRAIVLVEAGVLHLESVLASWQRHTAPLTTESRIVGGADGPPHSFGGWAGPDPNRYAPSGSSGRA
jgi:hypothetical protein